MTMAFSLPTANRTNVLALLELDEVGAAYIFPTSKGELHVIASTGDGWEHASASLQWRCPTWDEMCMVKDFFWGDEDTVIQYHPAKSRYINHHPFCLHLWRPDGMNIEYPPKWMIGPDGGKT